MNLIKPWAIKRGGADITIVDENGKMICAVPTPSAIDIRNKKVLQKDIDAVARMVAAAPELLSAIMDCLTHIEEMESVHGRTYHAGRAGRAVISRVLGDVCIICDAPVAPGRRHCSSCRQSFGISTGGDHGKATR